MANKPNDVTVNITYRFASGEKAEITADILVKQEGMSAADALELCKLIKDFEEKEAKQERRETRRHISLSLLDDDVNPPKPRSRPLSVEELIIMDEAMKKIFNIIDKELTPKQKQRLFYRIFEGLSEDRIGELEGVKQQAVSQSILQAVEKIKKLLD